MERRALRLSSKHYLEVPRQRTETGKRAFSFAATTTWNKLPINIRQLDPTSVSILTLKKLLKTHYFQLAYGSLVLLPAQTNRLATYDAEHIF